MQVIYEGTDITADISVAGAWLELYALGQSDRLTLKLGDVRGLWDGWDPKPGDSLSIEDGAAKSGEMEIVSVRPQSSTYTLMALSVPASAGTEKRWKSWQDVHLLQLVNEVCDRYGLTIDSYGIEDHTYEYVEQMGQPDFAFLSKRCAFEGIGILVYDKKLVLYSAEYMDSQAPNGDIAIEPGDDFKIMNDDFDRFGSCRVTNGEVSGLFKYGEGKEFSVQLIDRMNDISEANRFARGLLRHKNRLTKHVRVTTDSFLSQFAPGSVINFAASSVGSWDGAAFVENVRFDFMTRKTAIEIRPVITGY